MYSEQPCIWEGLFRIACLIKKKPMEEAVSELIVAAAEDSGDGSFKGGFSDQICTARALLALFEYNTDRSILKRISSWLRYTEIEYDSLKIQDGIMFRPADLMELLIRFYLVSGSKTALRLCAKLRAEAFDWTTNLHTFQQSIPIRKDSTEKAYRFPSVRPDEIGYDEKEKLINHSEMLADGVRYTIYAGLFSGHSRDLSSGKTVWPYLYKHHHALCGGTTGNPYLSGTAADQIVNHFALCAWTEAFAAQMISAGSEWASDEMIRIVFNGLDECLNRKNLSDTQRVNTFGKADCMTADPVRLYSRLTRAVWAAYSHAVSATENGICIHYLLPGKYMFMIGKQPVVLQTDYKKAIIHASRPFSARIEIYLPEFCTGSVRLVRNAESSTDVLYETKGRDSCYTHLDGEWQNRDTILFCNEEAVFCEKTHHQGVAFISSYRLMCMKADETDYSRAVCSEPVWDQNQVCVETAEIDQWKIAGNEPGDIPVLPDATGNRVRTVLIPYSDCEQRIAMFPRIR